MDFAAAIIQGQRGGNASNNKAKTLTQSRTHVVRIFLETYEMLLYTTYLEKDEKKKRWNAISSTYFVRYSPPGSGRITHIDHNVVRAQYLHDKPCALFNNLYRFIGDSPSSMYIPCPPSGLSGRNTALWARVENDAFCSSSRTENVVLIRARRFFA